MGSAVRVHADQALLVDESNMDFVRFQAHRRNDDINRALARESSGCTSSVAYDVVQKSMRLSRQDLTPYVVDELKPQDNTHFSSQDQVYEVLDCGLLGKNWERKQLHPFLKVWQEDSYLRTDMHCDFTFKK